MTPPSVALPQLINDDHGALVDMHCVGRIHSFSFQSTGGMGVQGQKQILYLSKKISFSQLLEILAEMVRRRGVNRRLMCCHRRQPNRHAF